MRGLYLRVGLLALAGLGLLVGAVLFFSASQIRHARAYETYFRDTVQGLDNGAAVKYRGVTIGAVTGIGLVSAEYGRGQPDADRSATYRAVLVRFEVDTERMGQAPGPAAVAEGLRARIAPQGLTGQSYVELDFFNPDRYPPFAVPWTPRDQYIPSITATLTEVKDSATALLTKLQQVDVNGLADGVLGLVTELRGTLRDGGDAQALLRQATATLKTVQAAVNDADVPALAAELRQTLASARTLAGGQQTKELLRAATTAADRLAQASAKLPALIATLDAVAHRADSGSADLEAGLVPLLRDARTTVAALRQTSEALRRDPAQAVLGGCSILPSRPYIEKRDWPLDPQRPVTLPARPGGPVLLVRTLRAAPGLEARGLEVRQGDGSIRTDFYEQWSVPPADAVEDALRRWLGASGLFAAVLAPGSRARADLALEGELLSLLALPAQGITTASLGIVLLDLRPAPVRVLLQADIMAQAALAPGGAPAIAASGKEAVAALLAGVERRVAAAVTR